MSAFVRLGQAVAAARLRLRGSYVEAGVVAAFGLYYLLLLTHYTGVYGSAGHTARTVQSRLAELRDAGHSVVFVTGHPDFVRGRRGTPLAQVFHWGLSDAMRPPFVDRTLGVFALRPLSDLELLPVLERSDLGTVWRWSQESESLVQLAIPEGPLPARIPVRGPSPDTLQFRAGKGSHRLFLLTRASTSVYPAGGSPGVDDWTEVDLPKRVVRNMRQLYEGEIYAWIEARQGGRLVAVSRLLRIASVGD